MKPLLTYVLPEDIPERDRHFVEFVGRYNMIAAPLAFALSYQRNGSIKWALIHGIIGAPYLAFRAAEKLGKDIER